MYFKSRKYTEDVEKVAYEFKDLMVKKKKFMVIGASGLIGRFMIDVLVYANQKYGLANEIICISRSENKLHDFFREYLNLNYFSVIAIDITKEIETSVQCDYIFQGASNTHPLAYANDPIGTIMTNVIGTQNILNFAKKNNVRRTIFFSSVEIYGENRGDVKGFSENYCGYIDCNTLRAGYTEAKRTCEALCQAFISKEKLDIVIARISRVFGPTVLASDSKASSQLIFNGVNEEDVVLKSEGLQRYSYSYVGDVVSALLFLVKNGENGEAYNIKGKNGDIELRDFAKIVADYSGVKLSYDIPSEVEKKGFSRVNMAVLDDLKVRELGWKPSFKVSDAIKTTIDILQEGVVKNDNK